MDPGGAIRAEALDGFARQLQDAGIRMLINTSETVADPNGKLAVFTGFDELRYGRTDIPKALSSLEGRAYAYRIGFGHNPDICLHLPEGSFHLFLCGHFHGGQIWAPFRFEFFRLRNEKLCKQGIYRGLHRIRKTDVYISRGIGNVLVPLRLGSLAEMTVFRIGAKP
ncbi:MAG TPA: hypothetical protein DD727_00315 [Clostridiales bacterium]|nr:hypothetical protein [Clostridiales bacterium]